MPLPRRLRYRDRFVWSLTQTMTGGSGSLPPVSFQDDVSTDILISLTGNEFNKILSCLMTGADLAYPDQSHEIVWSFLRQIEYPVAIKNYPDSCLWALTGTPDGTTWTYNLSNSVPFNHYMISATSSPPAGGVKVRSQCYLSAGNYSYFGYYVTTVNNGIINIRLTNVSGSTVYSTIVSNLDTYGLLGRGFVQTTFTVADTGLYAIELQNTNSKNASSGGYAFAWTMHQIRQNS